jgi:hypothetical protein
VATKSAPFSARGGREAELGLGSTNAWFVTTDPATVRASDSPEASLVILVPGDDEPLSELEASIRRAPWESMLAALAQHAVESRNATTSVAPKPTEISLDGDQIWLPSDGTFPGSHEPRAPVTNDQTPATTSTDLPEMDFL